MYSNRFLSHSTEFTGRRRIRAATVLAVALILSTAGVGHAATTSPGKKSAFVSATNIPMSSFTPTLTATIEKGKRKTVLAIEASYSDGASYPTPPGIRVLGTIVRVNGVTTQPNPSASYMHLNDCGFTDTPPVTCSITGTFWIDIDAAELANPGMFVGQPLVVELTAGDLTNGALVGVIPMDASLSVRVQKK